jgi:hypothetical protein
MGSGQRESVEFHLRSRAFEVVQRTALLDPRADLRPSGPFLLR